jgi:hypothetical protein
MPNQRKWSRRKGRKTGGKWAVARHRTMSASEADRCERAIERRERRTAREHIASEVVDLEQEREGF